MNCILGITANRDNMLLSVQNSIGIVTALNPYIGYRAAAKIAVEAHRSGQGIYDLVLARGLLTQSQLDQILAPANLIRPSALTTRL